MSMSIFCFFSRSGAHFRPSLVNSCVIQSHRPLPDAAMPSRNIVFIRWFRASIQRAVGLLKLLKLFSPKHRNNKLSQLGIRPISQIPQCTCAITHNAPFRIEMCNVSLLNMEQVYSEICELGESRCWMWMNSLIHVSIHGVTSNIALLQPNQKRTNAGRMRQILTHGL